LIIYKNRKESNLITLTADQKFDLKKIIKHHGFKNQIKKAIEELDELKVELIDYLEYDYFSDKTGAIKRITEEVPDVINMLFQLILIFDNQEEVQGGLDFKIIRTLERMKR